MGVSNKDSNNKYIGLGETSKFLRCGHYPAAEVGDKW